MKRLLLVTVVFASMVSADCLDFLKSATSPTPTTPSVDQLSGSWASVSSATSLTDTCTDFHWTVTGQSGANVTAHGHDNDVGSHGDRRHDLWRALSGVTRRDRDLRRHADSRSV
jgi:hypothetical protein